MVEIDSETLFTASAAVVATAAVLQFVLNVDLGVSPVSEVALVVTFLAGVFALTQRTDDRQATVLGYGVVVVSSVALFFDLMSTFDVGDGLTTVGLLVIASLLVFLRTRLDAESHFVPGRVATYAFGVVAALAVVVVLVDVVTGGLVYELQPASEVQVPDSLREEVRVGSVVATNPTPLPERVETPSYRACAAGNWSAFRPSTPPGEPQREVRVDVHVQDGYDEHVMGFGSKTYPVELHLGAANVSGETFPVRAMSSSCPDESTGAPYVAVFEAAEDRPSVRPA
jgi:hypothetical protein